MTDETGKSQGRIVNCPQCGKPAVVTEVDGKIYYNHGKTVVHGADNTVSFRFKSCVTEQPNNQELK